MFNFGQNPQIRKSSRTRKQNVHYLQQNIYFKKSHLKTPAPNNQVWSENGEKYQILTPQIQIRRPLLRQLQRHCYTPGSLIKLYTVHCAVCRILSLVSPSQILPVNYINVILIFIINVFSSKWAINEYLSQNNTSETKPTSCCHCKSYVLMTIKLANVIVFLTSAHTTDTVDTVLLHF